MRKLFSILVCLTLLLGFGGIAFAGSFDREDATTAGYVNSKVVTSDSVPVARACYLYAITLYAGSANSYANLYDSASSGEGGVIVEIAEATAGDTQRYEFAKPVKFDNGIYVDVTGSNAAVVLEYR